MSWLHAVREWIAGSRSTADRDADLAEEIRYHLELETARQVDRGHDPGTAERTALQRFGDPAHVIEATRNERTSFSMEPTVHDLRSALRSLRKHAGFTILALFTLALGIGATTTAFAVFNTVLIQPLPYRDSGKLVLLQERTAKGELQASSFPNFVDWRAQAHTFSGVASEMYPWAQTVTANGEPVRSVVMGVSLGFFRILGVEPMLGREFTADENREGGAPALMVSYDFWKTEMGSRTTLGTIRFGETPMPVVGVLPAGFRFVDDADIWFPHERWPGTCRTCRNYRVIGRLAPGATPPAARTEMTTISRRLHDTYGLNTSAVDATVDPLREFLVKDYQLLLTVVFGAAALVLLIACTNLVSAQLARGLGRGREMAVRAALGASRTRLMRQLLLESAILAVAGAALGGASAMLFTRIVRALGIGLLPRIEELRVNGTVLLFAAAVSIVAGALIGLYPAIRLTGGNPGKSLHGARGSGATVRRHVWRALVGFEVAVAVVLLVGSALLIRTMHNILDADTGFQVHGLVTAALVPGDTVDLAKVERIRAELAAIPGVQGVGFANRLPLSWGNTSGPVRRPTDPVDRDFPAMAGFRVVTPEYFGVLQLPVLKGRAFTAADREGSTAVAIVTPGIAAKLWPGQDPIGKQVITNYLYGELLTVVGVVAEASSWTMTKGEQNEIFTPLAQHRSRTEAQLVAVVRTSGDSRTMIPAIRSRLRTLVPEMPARLSTVDERIARSAADRKFAMVALTVFGCIALVLAGVGVYGTMAYIVSTRTHEIGVRMALGATPARMLGSVLFDAATMALGGTVAGMVAGFFATRYLSSTLYGVSHVDPVAYLAGTLGLFIVAIIGACVPAARSSRVDPLTAIRAE